MFALADFLAALSPLTPAAASVTGMLLFLSLIWTMHLARTSTFPKTEKSKQTYTAKEGGDEVEKLSFAGGQNSGRGRGDSTGKDAGRGAGGEEAEEQGSKAGAGVVRHSETVGHASGGEGLQGGGDDAGAVGHSGAGGHAGGDDGRQAEAGVGSVESDAGGVVGVEAGAGAVGHSGAGGHAGGGEDRHAGAGVEGGATDSAGIRGAAGQQEEAKEAKTSSKGR